MLAIIINDRMEGREGGREGWVDITTFNNSFTSFCFSLKRSS